MSINDNNGNGLIMPVAPIGNGGYNNGFGGDGSWWLILFILLLAGNNGWGTGFGGGGMPYMMGQNTQNDVQHGFDHAAGINGITGVQSAVTGLGSQIASGFASAEVADNARQMANMQQAFASQTAMTSGMTALGTQLANCCCENRLATANLNSTILAENCADRAAVSDALRDVITNQNAGVQRILDTMCQDKIDAKNEKIAELQNQLNMANLAASQTAQTAKLLADNAAQTQALEQYLNPVPIPAYQVQNPNCCNNFYNGYGCGCNG